MPNTGQRVLIVGPDVAVTETIRAQLALLAVEVETTDVDDALYQIAMSEPDLILIDLTGVDHPDAFLRNVRHEPGGGWTQLLIIVDHAEAAPAARVDMRADVVVQPFDADALVRRAAQLLERAPPIIR